jgi:hypothetical protein
MVSIESVRTLRHDLLSRVGIVMMSVADFRAVSTACVGLPTLTSL